MNDEKIILFVDDDQDFLASQSIYFSKRGYKVLTAEGGTEALKLLETEIPDIMVLDLMMDHFDSGFALTRRIHEDDRLKNVPLLMLSGVASTTEYRFDQDAQSLKNWVNLDAFLNKPITGKQLLKVIEEITGKVEKACAQRSVEDVSSEKRKNSCC
jgi:CheY-like chemotaxis protein